jgi:hypothetical protein
MNEQCELIGDVIHCRCGKPSSHYGTMGERGARVVRELPSSKTESLRVDAERWKSKDYGETGIFVRAQHPSGAWDSVDIVDIERDSLIRWLRSRGGHNPWAENCVLALLGHSHLSEEESRVETTCSVRPHDFCSAGTCAVCLDAARYHAIRAARVGSHGCCEIWNVAYVGRQLDEAMDAVMASNAVKTGREP